VVDRGGDTAAALSASGMSNDAVLASLDRLLQSQSVMLATNELMAVIALVFAAAACAIWLARRPTRSVDLSQAGH